MEENKIDSAGLKQMILSFPKPGKEKLRVGRGMGGRRGKTSGRGSSGQKSRAGKGIKPYFEGGQFPFYRRIPKLGKRGLKNRTYILRTSQLNKIGEGIGEVTMEFLISNFALRPKTRKIKILFDEKLKEKLIIKDRRILMSLKTKESLNGK